MRDWLKSEDWWAVWVGLFVFVLSLGVVTGFDLLGWGVTTREWIDPSKALSPISKTYTSLSGPLALLATYLFLVATLAVGSGFLGLNVGRFVAGFTVVFWASYACSVAGHFALIAATPDKRANFGLTTSLGLTGEAGYILALMAGLLIGNSWPAATAWLKEAARPEWYIKTAIVILGASLALKAASAPGLTKSIMLRGFAAIVEAYLIYWALVYLVARKFFKFSREWAAPLASGISICGVSAAIATGAAIRARPVVPIMVSSLVVVFSVVELILLPLAAQRFLYDQPMVAGAWMGLAVKTDGAAVASGAITDALIRTTAQQELGVAYEKDWILATTVTVKMFIDVFIGLWAFLLAWIWVKHVDPKPGETVRAGEIWQRFPKFVLGYFLTFAVMLGLTMSCPHLVDSLKLAADECNVFRGLFFVMTFFAIGLGANFKRLWEEGIGRLAAVYVVCLFGFIIWIGLAISWIFFHDVPARLVGSS